MKVWTARYGNKVLAADARARVVRTVHTALYRPKWPVGFDVVGAIPELAPPVGIFMLGKEGKWDLFSRLYLEHLARVGPDLVQRQLLAIAPPTDDVVLLCYEDVRKPATPHCHRRLFARWWDETTGEVVDEYPEDASPYSVSLQHDPVREVQEKEEKTVAPRWVAW